MGKVMFNAWIKRDGLAVNYCYGVIRSGHSNSNGQLLFQ